MVMMNITTTKMKRDTRVTLTEQAETISSF